MPGQERIHTLPRYFQDIIPGSRRRRTPRYPMIGDVRPNPDIGAFYYIPPGHSGHRTGPDLSFAVAYRGPPSLHDQPETPDSWCVPHPIYAPHSCVGPVIGVDHSKLSTAVLIGSHWLVIWSATEVRNRYGHVTHCKGQHYFLPRYIAIPHVREGPVERAVDRDWHLPFSELWMLDMELGLGHMEMPIRLPPPPVPRYLLTGPAWYRLFCMRDFLRNHADRDNAVSAEDLETARLMLYPRLDYDAQSYIRQERGPAQGLLALMQADWEARAIIYARMRRWIARRRHRRSILWAVFLFQHELLPEPVLALPHALLTISACL